MNIKISKNSDFGITGMIGKLTFQLSFTDNKVYPRFHKNYINKMYLVEWFCFAIGWLK